MESVRTRCVEHHLHCGEAILLGLRVVRARIVVALELVAIAYIRFRYMDTPFLSATFQIVVGGTLVFLDGILIGSA